MFVKWSEVNWKRSKEVIVFREHFPLKINASLFTACRKWLSRYHTIVALSFFLILSISDLLVSISLKTSPPLVCTTHIILSIHLYIHIYLFLFAHFLLRICWHDQNSKTTEALCESWSGTRQRSDWILIWTDSDKFKKNSYRYSSWFLVKSPDIFITQRACDPVCKPSNSFCSRAKKMVPREHAQNTWQVRACAWEGEQCQFAMSFAWPVNEQINDNIMKRKIQKKSVWQKKKIDGCLFARVPKVV